MGREKIKNFRITREVFTETWQGIVQRTFEEI